MAVWRVCGVVWCDVVGGVGVLGHLRVWRWRGEALPRVLRGVQEVHPQQAEEVRATSGRPLGNPCGPGRGNESGFRGGTDARLWGSDLSRAHSLGTHARALAGSSQIEHRKPTGGDTKTQVPMDAPPACHRAPCEPTTRQDKKRKEKGEWTGSRSPVATLRVFFVRPHR